jgi:hypothetical protein
LTRDDIRVDEDARPDDASHDDHRRVERAETAGQCRHGGDDGSLKYIYGARDLGKLQPSSEIVVKKAESKVPGV